jgi:hypothetical protein
MKPRRRLSIGPDGRLTISSARGRWDFLLPLMPWLLLGGGTGFIVGVMISLIVKSG